MQDSAQTMPILDVMGMQPGSVISSPRPSPEGEGASKAHYLLIIGYDYQPCFSPEKLGE